MRVQSEIKAKAHKRPSNLNRCSFKCRQCCLLSSYVFTRGCSVAHLHVDMCVGVCFRQSEKVDCSHCFHWPYQINRNLQVPGHNASKSSLPIRLVTEQGSEDSYGPSMIGGLEVTFSVSWVVAAVVPRLYLCFYLMFSTMTHLHRSHQTWPPGV